MLNIQIGGDVRSPDAVANNEVGSGSGFDDTLRELLLTPAVKSGNPRQDINEGRAEDNEMDGVVSHEHGPGAFGEVDWESVDSALSAEDFDLQSSLGLSLLHTEATTPENFQPSMNQSQNGYCVLQSLGAMTPLSTAAVEKEFGMFGDQLGSNYLGSGMPSSIESQNQNQNQSNSQEQQQLQKQQPRSTTQTDGQWLQKLVEINVRLFNHANQVTVDQKQSPPPVSSINAQTPSAPNEFDETVVLSLHFLQALRKLHSASSSRELPVAHITAAWAKAPPILDPGTTLIIYSCYIRVLELFIDRLQAIRDKLVPAASETSSASPYSPALLTLPTLAACSCSMDEYPVLKLRMTLELVEEILDVMGGLLLPIIRGPATKGSARGSGVGDGLWRDDEDEDGEQRAMPWRRVGRHRQPSQVPQVSQQAQALLTREETAYQIIRAIRRDLKASRRVAI